MSTPKNKSQAEILAEKEYPKSTGDNRIHPDVFRAEGYAKGYAAGQAAQWISVSERLPEMVRTAHDVLQSQYVLVYTDRKADEEYRISKAFLCKIGNRYPAWKSNGLGGVVTHWMPLPNPPSNP